MGERRTDLYVVNGVRVPSVTEVMHMVGIGDDLSMIDPDVLNHAADRGRRVHAISDAIDNDMVWGDDPMDEELAPYIQAYMAFKSETGFQVIKSEHVVVSAAYRFAGTLDRVGTFDKLRDVPTSMPFVVDLKAVVAVSMATRIQTAGYAFAYSEQEKTKNLGRASLQLMPSAKFRLKFYNNGRTDIGNFLSCVKVAHLQLAMNFATLDES